ncbi:hypothetical protein BU075_04405 [Mammaliicoccus vitulinus]|uniref:Uncharacterized protein n=1 Tax=Mammaliicoccus vitulinus TaxID=71237 RepID=A0A2T4PSS3_9STAP|nr:hypothetical protein CD107_12850 [Mammaliicoccus vitulinus]PTI29385.1 hypothetical protein BU072_08495 [Mammaliicoccus vitulinus]RIN16579.1 hypothetical protein BU075_04405 [Mammaliicoccus vitulinus]RTX89351.1 hypothetical protein CD108_04000 [Mammaliicoccus vitulinus]GGH97835.1 hypothetical protein GCM10007366_01690 [Mammaliicoccus vitulinus]
MKKFLSNEHGFLLPFLLGILFIYSAFLSFYLVQYSYKLNIYHNLEQYYQQEIKIMINKEY